MKLVRSILCMVMLSGVLGCDESSDPGICQEEKRTNQEIINKDCICTMEYAPSADLTIKHMATRVLPRATELLNTRKVLATIKVKLD